MVRTHSAQSRPSKKHAFRAQFVAEEAEVVLEKSGRTMFPSGPASLTLRLQMLLAAVTVGVDWCVRLWRHRGPYSATPRYGSSNAVCKS